MELNQLIGPCPVALVFRLYLFCGVETLIITSVCRAKLSKPVYARFWCSAKARIWNTKKGHIIGYKILINPIYQVPVLTLKNLNKRRWPFELTENLLKLIKNTALTFNKHCIYLKEAVYIPSGSQFSNWIFWTAPWITVICEQFISDYNLI